MAAQRAIGNAHLGSKGRTGQLVMVFVDLNDCTRTRQGVGGSIPMGDHPWQNFPRQKSAGIRRETAVMVADKRGMPVKNHMPVEIVQNKEAGEIKARGPKRVRRPGIKVSV